jgi:hypothetical protein
VRVLALPCPVGLRLGGAPTRGRTAAAPAELDAIDDVIDADFVMVDEPCGLPRPPLTLAPPPPHAPVRGLAAYAPVADRGRLVAIA